MCAHAICLICAQPLWSEILEEDPMPDSIHQVPKWALPAPNWALPAPNSPQLVPNSALSVPDSEPPVPISALCVPNSALPFAVCLCQSALRSRLELPTNAFQY
eukprot:2098675-Rhodomonas_salina.4